MDWGWAGFGLLGLLDRFRAVGRPRNIEGERTMIETGNGFLSASHVRASLTGELTLINSDELIRKYGFRGYREMLADETVKACLAFKKVLIHQRSWDIDPAGSKEASEDAKKQADFVRDNLEAIGMNKVLKKMLSCFDYGFSVAELIWEVKSDDDGELKVHLADVKDRDPQFIKITTDKHGNILSFIQNPGIVNEIVLKPEKVLHYAYNSQFSNHYGESDLRAAYRAWWSKKFITQFWNVFMERFGQPLMKMSYPSGAPDELKRSLRSILSSLSTRSDILVPAGVEIDLIEATRGGAAGYMEALTYCDVAISRALLVPALLGMGMDPKSGGSASQSRLHLRVLMKVSGDVCEDIENAINEKIIKPLIDMNFPDVKEYPCFEFQDYGEYEATEIVDSAINMFNAGMLDADQADINYLRSVLALPLRGEDEEDEVMRAPPPPVGTSPNDPNSAGNGKGPSSPSGGAGKNNNRAKKGASRKAPAA